MIDLAAWAFAALTTLAPHPFVLTTKAVPDAAWQAMWSESQSDYEARLRAIAQDIAEVSVSFDDAVRLVTTSYEESNFARDTDEGGHCYHDNAHRKRCDGGFAQSIWQHLESSGERRELYRTNRKEAARAELRKINASLRACAHLEPQHRYTQLAVGHCAGAGTGKAAETSAKIYNIELRVRGIPLVRAKPADTKPVAGKPVDGRQASQ